MLLKGIVSEADLKALVQKCHYSDEKKLWVIPRFRLTNQGVPVLAGQQQDSPGGVVFG